MGVTSTTTQHLILDAGVVYTNYGEISEETLGATHGGNTFEVTREIREIEVDGARGKIKGLRRKITENATLTVNLKEITSAAVQLALAGSTFNNDGTHDVIKSNLAIAVGDYLDNVALVAEVSGTTNPIIIIIENALADNDLSVAFNDKDEGVLEIQFSAHYDPDALTTVPYEIRYPTT